MNSTPIILTQIYRNLFLDYLSLFLDYLFSSYTIILFLFFIMILFFVKEYKQPFVISIAFILCAILSKFIKEIIKRPRPEIILELPITNHSVFSFPSGHTAAAFTFAVIFSRYYPKYKAIFYSIAVLTGLSRIYLGVHYLSDVLFGAFVGIISALFIIIYENEANKFAEKIINLKKLFFNI